MTNSKKIFGVISILLAVVMVMLFTIDSRYINITSVSQDGTKIVFTDVYLKVLCESGSEVNRTAGVVEKIIKRSNLKDYKNSEDLFDIEEGNRFVTKDKVFSYFEGVTEIVTPCLYRANSVYNALVIITKNNIKTKMSLRFKKNGDGYMLYYEDYESTLEDKAIRLWWSYDGFNKVGFLSSFDMIIKILNGEVNWISENKYYYYFNVSNSSVLTEFYGDISRVLKGKGYERFYELFPINDRGVIENRMLQKVELKDYYVNRTLLGSMTAGSLGISYFRHNEKNMVEYSRINETGVVFLESEDEPYWNIYTLKVKGFSAQRNDFDSEFSISNLLYSVVYDK
jgi:hypothetical protein